MGAVTDFLQAQRADHLVLAVCLSITGLSAAALWLLSRPTSWLSKQVDRAVTLPAAERTIR